MNSRELLFLHEMICNCRLCDLSICRTRAVPGAGPSDAEIMMVGEAPGKNEDLTGFPFVGRAGKLLDSALKEAGLNRSEIFITSTVKCRPPENRKPTKSELNLCQPHLMSQIDTIRPKVICLMGNTATSSILGITGVTSLRGQILQGRFLVTYHPAAVLRNRNLMEEFIFDLKKARTAAAVFPRI